MVKWTEGHQQIVVENAVVVAVTALEKDVTVVTLVASKTQRLVQPIWHTVTCRSSFRDLGPGTAMNGGRPKFCLAPAPL